MASLYGLVRPWLFRLDPERAHELVLRLLASAGGPLGSLLATPAPADPSLAQTLWGLSFVNPIGLAAGFAKNAECVPALEALGFGFVEVGTVTPRPQSGNEGRRLFRLAADRALVNRLGFNNRGVEAMAANLERLGARRRPLGVNLGRNKDTPNERAADDYLAGLRRLYRHADYFVINVSSPNTPGLRELQNREALRDLLAAVQAEAAALAGSGRAKPVLLKIAPDLSDAQLEDVVAIARETAVSGLIATNTTVARPPLRTREVPAEGGLSGPPLRARSTAVVADLYRLTRGGIPLIGVGGVASGADAYEKIRAGASLVQLYTGLVYEGPGLPGRIAAELAALLRRDGFQHVSEAVGVDAGGPRPAAPGVPREALQ